MSGEIAAAERDRIVSVLKEALSRGYTAEQVKHYVEGVIAFNEKGGASSR